MENNGVSEVGMDSSLEIGIAALAERIARWTEDGELYTTVVPGLSLFRRNEPTEPMSGMYEPSICMAVGITVPALCPILCPKTRKLKRKKANYLNSWP